MRHPRARRSLQLEPLEARTLLSTLRVATESGLISAGADAIFHIGLVGSRAAELRVVSEPSGAGKSIGLDLVVRQPDGAVVAHRTDLEAGRLLAFPARPGISYTVELRSTHPTASGTYHLLIQQQSSAPSVTAQNRSPVLANVSLPLKSGLPTATVAPFASRLVRGVASVVAPVEFQLVPTQGGTLQFQNLSAGQSLALILLPSNALQPSQTLTIAPGSTTSTTVTAGTTYRIQLTPESPTLVSYLLSATLEPGSAEGSTVQIL